MSVEILPRERGAVIECDQCHAVLITAQIQVKLIRGYAATQGWIRGLIKRSTGSAERGTGLLANRKHDICPRCAPDERRRAADRKAEADARRAARTAASRLTWEQKRELRKRKDRERRAAKKQAVAAA